MPRMADCLVCHNQIDPPFSCAQCHDPKWTGLQPANHHDTDFHDKHSTKAIVKQGCSLCHGRTFTCMGCHLPGLTQGAISCYTDPDHQTLAIPWVNPRRRIPG